MIADIPAEQVRDALERIALEILDDAGLSTVPPIDAFELAARLGLVVARDAPRIESAAMTRARFVRLSGAHPTILLADDPRSERRHWAVAHEIGEHYAGRVFAALGVDLIDAQQTREDVANRLAGCLLIPRDWLIVEGIAYEWDLYKLKASFATASHELIARRMLEIPGRVIITLWDQGKQVWRRSTAGYAPPLTSCERAVRQAAFDCGDPAHGDPAELPEGVVDVRAWPIHEPNWKREIIRTELADW